MVRLVLLSVGAISFLLPEAAEACMLQPPFKTRVLLPVVALVIAVFAFMGIFKVSGLNGVKWRRIVTVLSLLVIAHPLFNAILYFNPSGAADCNYPFTLEAFRVLFYSLLALAITALLHPFVRKYLGTKNIQS